MNKNKVYYIDEKALLSGLERGENRAMKQIFYTHYEYLIDAANYILFDREKSKDIVQEVLSELWHKRSSLKIKSALKPYLKRAVINRSINEYKRLKRVVGYEGNVGEELENSSHEKLEFEELNEHLKKAIDELPDRCKAIFLLKRFEGKSHQEISEELNISKKTIENQMTKALKQLRIALKNYNTLIIILLILAYLDRG